MYLAPADTVQGINLCPLAKIAGCREACLYSAGRGRFNSVMKARIRKTLLWRDGREEFLEQLRADITRFQAYCTRKGVKACVRLNGTSDIRWENYGIPQAFPDIQFYDYTKDFKRVYHTLPANYHLTLSYSEANEWYAAQVLAAARDTGASVAVVFRSAKNIPESYAGLPCTDGDSDDLRFLDPKGHVVALYAKGQAKKDSSGFVVL
jgi:hypothetical protein